VKRVRLSFVAIIFQFPVALTVCAPGCWCVLPWPLQSILLEHPDLIPGVSCRIGAIFLLYDGYKGESLANNPFTSVFAKILEVSSTPLLSICSSSCAPIAIYRVGCAARFPMYFLAVQRRVCIEAIGPTNTNRMAADVPFLPGWRAPTRS
jgi:hypothetical protein